MQVGKSIKIYEPTHFCLSNVQTPDQERKLLALESKLNMRTEALAELMEEHVRLKKSLGEA